MFFECWNLTHLLKLTSTNQHLLKFSVRWNFGHFYTHHSGLWVPLAAVAERGGQGGGAALVIQGRAAVVDGRVDRDCPHAWSVAIAVAVVIATAVSRGPHIDAAFASTSLNISHHRHTSKRKYILLITGDIRTRNMFFFLKLFCNEARVCCQWCQINARRANQTRCSRIEATTEIKMTYKQSRLTSCCQRW